MAEDSIQEGGLTPEDEITSQPDGSRAIVGFQGIPVRQDVDGTQIQRLGVAGADADWGPATVEITDGTYAIATPEGVGGTRSSSGVVESQNGENCSVAYVWSGRANDIDTLQEAKDSPDSVVEEAPALQNDTKHIIEDMATKSDNCRVFVVDESPEGTENHVTYTLNFH